MKPCIEAKDIPVVPGTATKLDGDVSTWSAGVEADLRRMLLVAKDQNAKLIGCASETKPKEIPK